MSKILPDSMIVVDGINLVKRHTKPNPQAGILEVLFKKRCLLINVRLVCSIR